MELAGKRVGIVGLGISGLGAARLCASEGAVLTVFEDRKKEDLAEKAAALPEGCRSVFGKMPSEEDLRSLDILVVSPGVPADEAFIVRAKEMAVPVWSEIELASRFSKAPILGVTGTNGKTTTTALLGNILSAYAPGSMAGGNIGRALSEEVLLVPAGAYLAAELSSFQLELIDSFRPKVAAVLNFTPDHLNRHHTYENYIAAKCRIFENQGPEDHLVLNFGDDVCRRVGEELAQRGGGPAVVYFGHCASSSRNQAVRVWEDEELIYTDLGLFGARTEPHAILSAKELQIRGAHNVENVMAAFAMALLIGAPEELSVKVIRAFSGVEHRIEKVSSIRGAVYYNDSKATNPDAAERGLLAMAPSPVILIAGGYDKEIPFDGWAKLFDGRLKRLLLIGDTARKIEEAAKKAGLSPERIIMAGTLEKAVDRAFQEAEEGDAVLLSPACASYDQFQSYEERGRVFKALVKDLEKKEEEGRAE